MHVPVLRDEVVQFLSPRRQGGLLVDATVGEGGHAQIFLSRDPTLELVGVDADPAVLAIAAERLAAFGRRCTLVHERFSTFFARFSERCPRRADAVLIDLGVSLYHFRSGGRGFSLSSDDPLDMRLDPGEGQTAAELIETLPEEELADVIYRYGEERQSRRIARAVKAAWGSGGVGSARELAEIVRRVVGGRSGRGLHPATRVFQALRIAVNDEIGEIERGLPAALDALEPGGRVGVISFHSLEDRAVKRIFRAAALPGDVPPRFHLVVKKPLFPSDSERRSNPSSRSAKLRVIERASPEPRELGGAA